MSHAEFYERALARIFRFTIAVGLIGTIVTFALHGPRVAAGFLLGSVLSAFNFYSLQRLVESLDGSGGASTGFFAVRYFLVGGVVYVIVKILVVTLVAVLAGLSVSAAAVIIEILYELIYART
jgi:hypothetical protein